LLSLKFSFLLGLQQPGFLTNLNHLIPWDINPHSNQTSAGNAAAAGAAKYHQQRTTAGRSYKNNRRGFYSTFYAYRYLIVSIFSCS
jgi:hypothetical protein